MITVNSQGEEVSFTIRGYDVYGIYEFRTVLETTLNSGEVLKSEINSFYCSLADGFDGEFQRELCGRPMGENEHYRLYLNNWLIAMRTADVDKLPAGLSNPA